MVYNVQAPSDGKSYTLHSIPKGYSTYLEVNGQRLFYNEGLHRLYNPSTGQYYNIMTKGFENLGASVLDPIIFKSPVPQPTHNGRKWEKVSNFSSATLRKLASSLSVLFAMALAAATAFGGYATYALLVGQGTFPVGVVVGFLTAYFAVATYKFSKIALERLQQKN